MKYLGIDYGTKRIGIAISDDNGEFAFPKSIIPSDAEAIQTIINLIEEESISVIVIGESLASNEQANPVLSATLRFKEKLASLTTLPIELEREGFSTFEAHRYQTKKGSRDDSAAAIILQRYLDKHAS